MDIPYLNLNGAQCVQYSYTLQIFYNHAVYSSNKAYIHLTLPDDAVISYTFMVISSKPR